VMQVIIFGVKSDRVKYFKAKGLDLGNNYEDYEKSAEYIKGKIKGKNPKIAIVLGSGLGGLAKEIKNETVIKYKDIPNFPVSTVEGHAGELIIGDLNGTEVIAMNGRFHYYEGYEVAHTAYPIRVFSLLGIEDIILTNAAGGINTDIEQGSLMIINDHLSFFAESVLRGKNEDKFGVRFPDMSEVYSKELIEKLRPIMLEKMGRCYEGVYAYMKGPCYETPAEIRALRILGADAVGMSTVPEAITARHCGINVIAVSCITNMAAGIIKKELSHEEVKETAQRVEKKFVETIKEFVTKI